MNNCGIPIFVINMAESVERLKDVTRQLNSLELNFTRIDAVVGADLTDSQIRECYDKVANKKQYHRNLTKGEIGCYLSHRRTWQHIVDENIDVAIILEDDIEIQPILVDSLDVITNSSGWDLLKISDTEMEPPANSKSLTKDFQLVSYFKVPNRTMAYAITRETAQKFLSASKFFRPVDVDAQCYDDFNITVCGLRPNAVEMSEAFGLPEDSEIAKANNGNHSSRSTLIRNLKYRWKMHKRRKHPSYNLNAFKFTP